MKTLTEMTARITDAAALIGLAIVGVIVYVPLTIYVKWIGAGE